jgi:hypothetical protein
MVAIAHTINRNLAAGDHGFSDNSTGRLEMIRREILGEGTHVTLEWINGLKIVMYFQIDTQIAVIDAPCRPAGKYKSMRACGTETIVENIVAPKRQMPIEPTVPRPVREKYIAPKNSVALVFVGFVPDSLQTTYPGFGVIPTHQNAFLPIGIGTARVRAFIMVGILLELKIA